MEEILERQLLIRGRAFATFSTIEKVLAGPQGKLSQAVCCAGGVYMNWIDSHSRVDEGVTVESCRIL